MEEQQLHHRCTAFAVLGKTSAYPLTFKRKQLFEIQNKTDIAYQEPCTDIIKIWTYVKVYQPSDEYH